MGRRIYSSIGRNEIKRLIQSVTLKTNESASRTCNVPFAKFYRDNVQGVHQIRGMIGAFKSNPERFWSFLKCVKGAKRQLPVLCEVSGDVEGVNMLNRTFAEKFTCTEVESVHTRCSHVRPPDPRPTHRLQARIQGVGAGADAHHWDGHAALKIRYSIPFKHQSITGPRAPSPGRNPVSTTGLWCRHKISPEWITGEQSVRSRQYQRTYR